jgi:hypothetical protein
VPKRFNPPPAWEMPAGWMPPPGWEPDPAWPDPPEGWQLWVEDAPARGRVLTADSWWVLAGGAAVCIGSLLPWVFVYVFDSNPSDTSFGQPVPVGNSITADARAAAAVFGLILIGLAIAIRSKSARGASAKARAGVYGIPLLALSVLGILGCGVLTLAGFAGFSEGNGLGIVSYGIFTLAGAGAIQGPDGTAGSARVTFIPNAGLILIFLGCVAAGVGGISYLRHAARIRDRSGMTTHDADGASGTVTICKAQGLFLRADDAGLLMRNFYGRTHRIAWTEISHFADGSYTNQDITSWELLIILRTGKRVRVASSRAASAGEVVAAVREAAQPHGIPADLSGVAAKRDGRPALRGLYRDPGGQPGWRYWDGRQWSPLLPPDISESRAEDAPKVPDSWSALPTADESWTYAAAHARSLAVLSAVCAAAAAGLLAWALLIQLGLSHLWWHGSFGVGGWFSVGIFAAGFALIARRRWRERKFFLKLDAAAQSAPRGR